MTQDLITLGIPDADWTAIDDALTTLEEKLEKADDSEVALGSDIMVFSLTLYGILKAIGARAVWMRSGGRRWEPASTAARKPRRPPRLLRDAAACESPGP